MEVFFERGMEPQSHGRALDYLLHSTERPLCSAGEFLQLLTQNT